MGWDFQNRKVRDVAAEVMAELGGRWLDHSVANARGDGYNKVFYGAYQCQADGRVVAAVVLVQDGFAKFGYKAMDESMGPNEARCPAHVLAKLSSPAPNEYAAAWRQRCYAALGDKRVSAGQMDLGLN